MRGLRALELARGLALRRMRLMGTSVARGAVDGHDIYLDAYLA